MNISIKRLCLYVYLLCLSFSFLIPLVWLLTSSLRSDEDIFKNTIPFTWRTLVPFQPQVDAYIFLFSDKRVPFVRALINTIVVSVVTAAIGCVVNGLAGFAFAKYNFRGKNLLLSVVLLGFLIPTELLVVPLYLVCSHLKITNTYISLILPMAGNGIVILMFKQFFEELPNTILEAARIDGAPWWRVMTSIVVPLSRPAIISGGITLLIFQWDSLFWPLVAAPHEKFIMIQVALSKFVGEYKTNWNMLFAGSTISALIPVILFLVTQRIFFTSFEGSEK